MNKTTRKEQPKRSQLLLDAIARGAEKYHDKKKTELQKAIVRNENKIAKAWQEFYLK